MRAVPLLLLFLLSFSGLHADGKMYRLRETVPANIPYQRALIFHRDSAQTMLLQSSYRLPPDAPPDDLAWVIPLPAVPEVAALVPGVAEDTFFWLDRQTVGQFKSKAQFFSPFKRPLTSHAWSRGCPKNSMLGVRYPLVFLGR